jgi:histidine triad (HIT) family protein
VEFLWDLEEVDYNAVMAISKKLATHLRSVLNVPYVGVKVVGVDVPHAHVHLLPFTTSDEYSRHGDMSAEPDHAKLAALAAKLAI